MITPYSLASEVLAVVQDALETAGRPVADTLVAVGGLVMDECCDGILTVGVERVWRSIDPWPTEATGDRLCGEHIGVNLLVRVDRCVPVPDDDGAAPLLSEQEAASVELLQDAAVVWATVVGPGVLGADAYGDPWYERAMVQQTFTEPLGGCAAVETRFALGVPVPVWCVPAEA